MNQMLIAAILLLGQSPAVTDYRPDVTIGPLAQSFFPDDDDDRPELFVPDEDNSDPSNFEPSAGDSDPSNFEPEEGDSNADNFESPDLDELD